MKAFKIEIQERTFYTLSAMSVGRALSKLNVDESVKVTFVELPGIDYESLPATERFCEFFEMRKKGE